MMSAPPGDFRRDWLSMRDHFGSRQQSIVGANEDRGDGPLHIDRSGNGEEARQLVQTLAIAEAMARQGVERADLRAGSVMRAIPLATTRISSTSVIGRCPR